VQIENIKVTAKEIFDNKFPSLEEVTETLNIILSMKGQESQKFSIEFADYHDVILKKTREYFFNNYFILFIFYLLTNFG
jgi:hypothetical protein